MSLLFAELDATGWVVVISAGFVGLTGTITSVLSLWLSYKERDKAADREVARIVREMQVAQRVRTVAKKAAVAVAKIDQVSAQVEEVRHQTNSLKDELVDEVRKASFAAGVKSGKDSPEEEADDKQSKTP